MNDYYDRRGERTADGGLAFSNEVDAQAEAEVGRRLEEAWSCKLHRFGRWAPIDWFAERGGEVVAVVEMKARTHATEAFATVFLNVRKWLTLQLYAIGMGVPAIYVVRFADDEVRYIDVRDVDTRRGRVKVAGLRRKVKGNSDIEPMIEVPLSEMRVLGALDVD